MCQVHVSFGFDSDQIFGSETKKLIRLPRFNLLECLTLSGALKKNQASPTITYSQNSNPILSLQMRILTIDGVTRIIQQLDLYICYGEMLTEIGLGTNGLSGRFLYFYIVTAKLKHNLT